MNEERKNFFAKILLMTGLIAIAYFISFPGSNYKILAIDVHEHIVLNSSETDKLISAMDFLNIQKMVLLDTPSVTFGKNENFEDYDKNVEIQLKMKAQYPARFLVLYTYPTSDLNGPRKIEKYYKDGIDGLKFYNGVISDLGPINSSEMYLAYQKARQFNLSVIMHAEAGSEDQLPQFEQVLGDFPDVIFICPHLCGVQSDLELLDSLLNKYSNLYTDTGPWQRVGKFAVQEPEKFREFYIKHSDRIMYASDLVRADDVNEKINMRKWFQCERDLLEKSRFICLKEGTKISTGLHLPEDALTNIYQNTPKKVYTNA